MIDRTQTPLSELILFGEKTLSDAGIVSPKREVRLLIAYALQIDLSKFLMMDKSTLVPSKLIKSYIRRRAQHEPFAYITGKKGFWSLELKVSPSTLIPRADSEALIEALLLRLVDRDYPYQILDLGTGTGCLMLAALSEYKKAFGVGVDKIKKTLDLAKKNAERAKLRDRLAFVQSDWASSISGKFDVVISNPPYIPTSNIETLMPDVKNFEPLVALDGGRDGLDYYRIICNQAVDLLTKSGILILELGINQDQDVVEIARFKGLAVVQKQQDLNGCVRALVLVRSTI
ncbi:Release factor glutamine methyltransferase [Commensalibacter sp. Nvir]|uniref:peptide chain release factor N(5)-glutamine methyltransferase n=1 Tax=Commensalibacter sp. Nvir TaxID=3069817 RepID=UPI002D3CDF8C|nr:Release factor glutamine methyltransferase [Commensalibacter sp. Nvir]